MPFRAPFEFRLKQLINPDSGAKGVQALEADAKRLEVEMATLREARKPYALQPELDFPAKLVNVKHESDDTRYVHEPARYD